jgi:3-methyladenine DNA glycosylase AlkD
MLSFFRLTPTSAKLSAQPIAPMPAKTTQPATLNAVRRRLQSLGDGEDAAFLQRFFKTAEGQYGAGDRFLGIRVPVTRRLAREFRDLPLEDVERLLYEPWHEARLLGVILLGERYARASEGERNAIYKLYLGNTDRVNNWDLVDASAPYIVGTHLLERPRAILDKLARSKNLWERRIAIVATHKLIRAGQFDDTIRIATKLLDDPHDLIHKATGWMLREVGKYDPKRLEAFLDEFAPRMPRTMLRYAIERMPAAQRRRYLDAGKAG